MVSSVKLLFLKKGEYILWTMKMEQYLAHTDYAPWEVILNGNSVVQMPKDEAGNEIKVIHVTAQQILARTKERKAKSTLLMAIPDEHLARFHGIKDTKTLWAAIKTRFCGNVESKKMQKNVLKQQYKFFSISNSEGLDKDYDRFQRLLSLLEIHEAGVSTEDANQKFLKSLPSAWSNISLIIRNKPGIETLDIDDVYNNLKVYEADIKGSSGSSSNLQNVAFVSAESTSNTNELNAAYSVSTATGHNSQAQGSSLYVDELMFSFFANQSSTPQLDKEDLEQIDQDNLKEIDLKCRSARNSGNKSRDAGNAGYRGRDNGKRPAKEEDAQALVVQDGLGTYEWSYQVEEEATDFALMAFTSNPSSSNSESNKCKVKTGLGYDSQFNEKEVLDIKEEEVTETVFDNRSSDEENSLANDRFKNGEGYHAVSHPLIGNYMPPKPELSFAGLDDSIYKFKMSETVTSLAKDEQDALETSTVCVEKPKEDRSSAPLIEDWETYNDDDIVFTPEPIPAKIDFVKAVESVKHVKPVTPVKTAEQTKKSKNFSSSPKVDRKNWNEKMTQKLGLSFGFTKKACFVCSSLSHLIKGCTFHEDRMAKKSVLPTNVGKGTGHMESRPVWNNVQRINHQNKFAPTAIFTRSGRIPVSAAKPKSAASTSAAKPVNTAGPKQSVNFSKERSTFHKSRSPIRMSFYNATAHSRRKSTERVNTVGSKAVSVVKGNGVTAVKTSATSHELQTEAHIKQILPSLSTYQRNHKKTHKPRKAKKVTELPHTSVALDIGADEAVHQEGGDSVERAITTNASLVAAQDSDNITKTQSTAISIDPIYQEIASCDRPRRQESTLRGADAQTRFETASKRFTDPPLSTGHTVGSDEDKMEQKTDLTDFVPPTPHDSPLPGGHTSGSDEGRPNLLELMNIYTKLSNRFLALEEEKTTQDMVITILKLRVRRLEKKRKARTSKPMKKRLFKGRVETSTDKSLEVIIEDNGSGEKEGSTTKTVSNAKPDISAARPEVSTVEPKTPPTTTTLFNDKDVTIADTLVKMKSQKAKKKRVAFKDADDSARPIRSITTLPPLLTIDPKDKGKSVLVEEEPEKLHKVKRKDQGLAQIESDADLAQRIYKEELAELDRAKKERQKQEEATIAALTEEFDEIQAKMDDDHELDVRMTHEEQEMYIIEEKARLLVESFERGKKQLAAERAEAIRNKLPTRTQVRNMMITYLKHMGKYTHQQLKHKTLEELQMLYEREKKWIDDFVPMDSEMEEKKSVEPESKDKKGKRTKRVADSTPKHKSFKKQKMMQDKNQQRVIKKNQQTMNKKMKRNVDMEDKHVYKIIRANGNTSYHKSLSSMLRKFDRQDLVDLHRLMMKRFKDNTPEEKRYLLIKEMLEKMLNWKLEAEAESTMEFELLKFIKSQIEE
uniref:Uncharacterized protein n=1 Tax=Tanacetum cinerariifolium TaxID=118510 RepID=A0A6L2LD56_TANCI|nr:hypothetical protein [Tanacetum cinerariifolium]